jgi:S-sulfo-L-cysteine synthase (O-acetyl-L-serine-dependent)
MPPAYANLAEFIGNTPMARLARLPGIGRNTLLAKLEGNNPAGSVKDRPAYSMIRRALERGEVRPGDTLIEATSGNTGIALAMVAATQGIRMILIMPEHLSVERRAVMKAFGAEIILVTQQQGMEGARDLALKMQAEGRGRVLDQFANPDNPRAHYDTGGAITHFVSSMGTTGTIMGCSRFFKEKDPAIQVIGVQPDGESSIPGIRKWPEPYLPKIFDRARVDRVIEVSAEAALETMRQLSAMEGLFCGPSAGGTVWAALQLARELSGATIVAIIPDRGDRYISTGVFPS